MYKRQTLYNSKGYLIADSDARFFSSKVEISKLPVFREDRYLKTGETESVLLFERLIFNADDKINRVVQWMRPVE